MKLEELVGAPARFPTSTALRMPTSGDVLRHLWTLQNEAENGTYTLETLYNAVASDLIDHYASQSLQIIIAKKHIVR